jgi:hypothetical protein
MNVMCEEPDLACLRGVSSDLITVNLEHFHQTVSFLHGQPL